MNETVERAREFLNAGADTSVSELLEQLLDLRREIHPDRFQGSEALEAAEARFKEAQSLIEDLKEAHNSALVQSSNRQLALVSAKQSDLLVAKLHLNELQKRIDALRSEIAKVVQERDTLQTQLDAERDSRREQELSEIKKIYEPSRRGIVSLTVTVFLAAGIAILTKVDEVAQLLEKYSPFEPSSLKIAAFVACSLVLLITTGRYLKHIEFIRMMSEVTTTEFSLAFLSGRFAEAQEQESYGLRYRGMDYEDYYDLLHHGSLPFWRKQAGEFTEVSVVAFLYRYFTPPQLRLNLKPRFLTWSERGHLEELEFRKWSHHQNRLLRLLGKFHPLLQWVRYRRYSCLRILGLLEAQPIEHLKDAFIYHLLHRRLLERPGAKDLTHYFQIKLSEYSVE